MHFIVKQSLMVILAINYMDPKTQKISQFVPEKIFEGGEAQPHQNLKKGHCEHYLFHYCHFIQIEHPVLLPFPKKTPPTMF